MVEGNRRLIHVRFYVVDSSIQGFPLTDVKSGCFDRPGGDSFADVLRAAHQEGFAPGRNPPSSTRERACPHPPAAPLLPAGQDGGRVSTNAGHDGGRVSTNARVTSAGVFSTPSHVPLRCCLPDGHQDFEVRRHPGFRG